MSYIKSANKICIGSANFGSSYGINKKKPISKKVLKKIFSYAKKNKINFIDTAINYKKSEINIGSLNKTNIKIITKISKIPKYVVNIEKWIIKKTNESCKRLNIKKLYGLLVHDTSELRNNKKAKLFYKAFDYLIQNKIVEKVGLSIYEPKELDKYFNSYNFKIVQTPINILDRRIASSGWLRKLKNNDVEIYARSIFLKGILLKDVDKIDSSFLKWKKKLSYFEKWTKKNNLSKIEACIRYVDSFKEIDKIIFGISNEKQLEDNAKFLKKNRLYVSDYLNINSGNILNPKKWKI